jgi:hypothetical protein
MDRTEHTLSHAGPSLLGLAVVYTLLVLVSVIPGLLLKHGPAALNPYISAEESRRFFADNPLALRVAAFFSFGSSVPLGIYAATVVSHLRFLGVRAAGSYIALFGGFAASAALVISAFCAWVMSVPEVSASMATTRVLHFMTLLVWWSELCRRVWPACGWSIGHQSFLPPTPPMVGLVRHSDRSSGRALVT